MKTAFEKIRSLVERRKYFQELVQNQSVIVCKDDHDHLFSFLPKKISDTAEVLGSLVALDSLPQKSGNIVGNFGVGDEKFFFHGSMQLHGSVEATIPVDVDVFKLQRRAHVRLLIGPEIKLYMIITQFRGKSVYIETQVCDISASGVRVQFAKVLQHSPPSIATVYNPGLRAGDKFSAVIHPPSGKTLEVLCEVKHQLQSAIQVDEVDQYGCEFIDLAPIVKNRLLAMSMDLQRKIMTGK